MAYGGRLGLTRAGTDVLWDVVRAMDTTERAWRVEQLEAGRD